MASAPKPTKAQLRQHALDRALVEAVVHRVAAGIGDEVYDPKPEELAEGIVKVAKAFEEYLEEAVDRQPEKPEANLGLATTRDLLLELHTRGKVVHRGTPIEEDMLALMRTLEHDMETLNYRPADA